MSFDSAVAHLAYTRNRLVRFAKTPEAEKQFKEIFGFVPNLHVTVYVRQQHVRMIQERLRKLVNDWVRADENFHIVHGCLVKTRRLAIKSRRRLNLKTAYEELTGPSGRAWELWEQVKKACPLPAEVGYFEISQRIEDYLPEEEHAKGIGPIREKDPSPGIRILEVQEGD